MSVVDEDEKKFVIKHVFKDVKMQFMEKGVGAKMIGPVEEHAGVEWRLRLFHDEYAFIDFHLDYLHDETSTDWSIETEFEAFVNGKSVRCTTHVFSKNCRSNDTSTYINFYNYNEYSTNNEMPVEIHVTIRKMTEIEKKKLRNFDDESAKEHSDVMLKIGDEKFYVNKMYLSLHSSYFKSLFSGNFKESEKSEIELKDIDPVHFQYFLEFLYAESFIEAHSVLGILHLADFFDSKTVIRRCQEFLVKKSNLPLKQKFEAAIKYNLEELKSKCISEMKTAEDIRLILPKNSKDFDTEIWMELVNKLLSFK